jgi:membrane protease YdiL (CAAX protease family)
MKRQLPEPPGFARTVLLLLGATRKRSQGRRTRQQQLLQQKSGKSAANWGGLGSIVSVLVMVVLNVLAAFVVNMAVQSGERIQAESKGKIVVSQKFLEAVGEARLLYRDQPDAADQYLGQKYLDEAERIENREGGSAKIVAERLRKEVREHGTENLITKSEGEGVAEIAKAGQYSTMLGSLLLISWGVMLVFQGEGVELDLQRRKHPMWEWIFSHPVQPGPVFFAEMLGPFAANPIYWSAPLFVGTLYGMAYDAGTGFIAAFVIGLPVSIAAACLGKALEIGVILRFSPRSRGAIAGLMGWLGYATMMLFFFGLYLIPRLGAGFGKILFFLTAAPWPWLRLFLGGQTDGTFSFAAGLFACWVVAFLTIAGGVSFGVWGAQRGLTGNFSVADTKPTAVRIGKSQFGADPVYRKEYLWFIRDRSAIVQSILIPITVAGFQLFNLRWLLTHAQDDWNYLCGAAILFGTYFLWVLGPKSLASEGTALWIALTWPRGLESILKAKAWLWSLISTGLVTAVLIYACFVFPTATWRIALVGIGWFIFSRSMAEKSVTLVTVASSSGEQEKIPAGRRWAAQLGMLTFAIGVLTQRWPLAIVGIVYSYVTAAAMWQNLRARLPFLYDPWSEKLPPPPTLMHAMIAISILVEGGAVFTGLFVLFADKDSIAIMQAISYAICAGFVSIGVWKFLSDRDVFLGDVLRWEAAPSAKEQWWRNDLKTKRKMFLQLGLGAVAGAALGLFAIAYREVLLIIPSIAEGIRKAQEQLVKIPELRVSLAVMAVGIAPFAEEYLFRGLLYRALDREWGGWRAVVGSAAFFAIYHPALSWIPVGLLGAVNAILFKKTGRLAPAVALHMVYNAVVLLR